LVRGEIVAEFAFAKNSLAETKGKSD